MNQFNSDEKLQKLVEQLQETHERRRVAMRLEKMSNVWAWLWVTQGWARLSSGNRYGEKSAFNEPVLEANLEAIAEKYEYSELNDFSDFESVKRGNMHPVGLMLWRGDRVKAASWGSTPSDEVFYLFAEKIKNES